MRNGRHGVALSPLRHGELAVPEVEGFHLAAWPETACRSRASRHAEAIETEGMVRPLRIAEIDGAASEGDGLQRRPDWIGEIRAGFHHDDQATGPGDVEP